MTKKAGKAIFPPFFVPAPPQESPMYIKEICGIMFAKAMSSAKYDKCNFSLCLHIRKFAFAVFYRAKPVTWLP